MAAAAKRTDGGKGEGPSRQGTSDRRDLISNQPDVVLGTIVSLLPTKDGCRTQALSRRWRHIWRSAPLNLDAFSGHRDLPEQTICAILGGHHGPVDRCRELPEQTIGAILSGHLGPVRRISICIAPLPCRYEPQTWSKINNNEAHDARSRLEARLSSREVLAGLQVLDIDYTYSVQRPSSVFHLAPALREASSGRCSLPPNLVVKFPSLEKLSLYSVSLTEETLTAVLAGCPALRTLLVEETVGSQCFRISSPTLRSIGFCAPWDRHIYFHAIKFQELVIEDAPCLERLLPLRPNSGPATIRVVQAPKLEILGRLSKGTSQLHLGTTVFQKMISASLTTTMSTVKILALDDVGSDLDVVLDFLKCFPCLERLYMVLHFPDPHSKSWIHPPKNIKTIRKYALPDDPIECLKFHLKKVVMKVYDGKGLKVEFARFFVLDAKVLERMEFGIVNDRTDEWRLDHNMQLHLEDRASRDARFVFKRFRWSTFTNNDRLAHDLSTVDPFNASFLEGFVTLWEV